MIVEAVASEGDAFALKIDDLQLTCLGWDPDDTLVLEKTDNGYFLIRKG